MAARVTVDRSQREALRSLRARCGGAAGPSASEVEQALESGFGSLMALEARLQEVQTTARSKSRAVDEEHSAQQLVDEINVLRDALTELQAATSSDVTSPLAAGFVLPRRRV